MNIPSSYFMAEFECKNCGVQYVSHFVGETELLRNGITIEEIAAYRNKLFK